VIADAVQRYLEEPRGRTYRLREVALLVGAFALTLLLLDADGLKTWATRMEVGGVQDFWLALIEPWQRGAERAGLTAPRRYAVAASDRLAAHLGGSPDDASDLLARGWKGSEPTARAASRAPIPLALVPRERPKEPGAPFAERDLASAPAAPGPATVLLLGDSMMAANLASAIARGLEGDGRVKFVQAHREATGLSRPDVFDWPSVVPELLAAHRPRLIVCSFGGNDAQRVRLSGRRLEYGDERWDELYHGRVRAMMQALAGTDADVLWLGLPPMRASTYDERMQHLNTIFASEARELARVSFRETASAVAAGDGGFTAYVRGPGGKLVRTRLDDGVHYAPGGAQAVAARVIDWIQSRLGQRTKTASLAR
jgi:hypothetical protein